jgi:hypothetical protein
MFAQFEGVGVVSSIHTVLSSEIRISGSFKWQLHLLIQNLAK